MSPWSPVSVLLRPAWCPSPGAGHRSGLTNPCVAVKRGNCPEDRLRCLSPIQHLCNKDSDCRGSSRCCLGACGRDCRNPVQGTFLCTWAGFSPSRSPSIRWSFQVNKSNGTLTFPGAWGCLHQTWEVDVGEGRGPDRTLWDLEGLVILRSLADLTTALNFIWPL